MALVDIRKAMKMRQQQIDSWKQDIHNAEEEIKALRKAWVILFGVDYDPELEKLLDEEEEIERAARRFHEGG